MRQDSLVPEAPKRGLNAMTGPAWCRTRMRIVPAVLLLMLLAPGTATGAPTPQVQAVVLVHHPFDQWDPFGVLHGDGDSFSSRYRALADGTGSFPFPTLVVDGVDPVLALPQPAVPYLGTLENYTQSVQRRLAHETPLTLTVAADVVDGAVHATAIVAPISGASAASDAGATASPHLWAAAVEDHIYYRAKDDRVYNGISNHRFTVRAIQDLGTVNATFGLAQTRAVSFRPANDWNLARMSVAFWVQADAAFGRFEPREVLQAASATLGAPAVVQTSKAVLIEMYSATWCAPCLYGDLAIEQVAIRYAGATNATAPTGPKYYQDPANPIPSLGLALAAGLAVAVWTRRRT